MLAQPSRDRDRDRDREREKDKESRDRKEKDISNHNPKDRIGNYIMGAEIGRGSFATVYKAYRSVSPAPLLFRALASRQRGMTGERK